MDSKSYNQALEEYKEMLIKRLIPHYDDLEIAKYSETCLAITEIAEQLRKE